MDSVLVSLAAVQTCFCQFVSNMNKMVDPTSPVETVKPLRVLEGSVTGKVYGGESASWKSSAPDNIF